MNVNSRGHNLDTRVDQYFQEIKHPPGLKNPVGVSSSSSSIDTSRTDSWGGRSKPPSTPTCICSRYRTWPVWY